VSPLATLEPNPLPPLVGVLAGVVCVDVVGTLSVAVAVVVSRDWPPLVLVADVVVRGVVSVSVTVVVVVSVAVVVVSVAVVVVRGAVVVLRVVGGHRAWVRAVIVRAPWESIETSVALTP
jgi:hypothetical protein